MLDESLVNALKLGFSTSAMKVKIPSIDENREFAFREPNVKEVNTISKVILSNSDSQSTVYASSLVFLKYICLDGDFDPYAMSEIDRLKLLTYILSGIFFSKNLTIKCPRVGCNTSFPFSIKYGDILKKLDSLSNASFEFENHSSAGKAVVKAKFPSTSRYLDFLEFADGLKNNPVDYNSFNDVFVEIDSTKTDYANSNSSSDSEFVEKIKKRREILKGKISKTANDGESIIGNVDIKKIGNTSEIDADMSYLYIDTMKITEIPNSKDDYELSFGGLSYVETLRLLDVIPMRILIRDSDGCSFMRFVSSELNTSLNGCSPEIICPTCGHNISKKIGIQNFFIHG